MGVGGNIEQRNEGGDEVEGKYSTRFKIEFVQYFPPPLQSNFFPNGGRNLLFCKQKAFHLLNPEKKYTCLFALIYH